MFANTLPSLPHPTQSIPQLYESGPTEPIKPVIAFLDNSSKRGCTPLTRDELH